LAEVLPPISRDILLFLLSPFSPTKIALAPTDPHFGSSNLSLCEQFFRALVSFCSCRVAFKFEQMRPPPARRSVSRPSGRPAARVCFGYSHGFAESQTLPKFLARFPLSWSILCEPSHRTGSLLPSSAPLMLAQSPFDRQFPSSLVSFSPNRSQHFLWLPVLIYRTVLIRRFPLHRATRLLLSFLIVWLDTFSVGTIYCPSEGATNCFSPPFSC